MSWARAVTNVIKDDLDINFWGMLAVLAVAQVLTDQAVDGSCHFSHHVTQVAQQPDPASMKAKSHSNDSPACPSLGQARSASYSTCQS